jgi:hypothetical protein
MSPFFQVTNAWPVCPDSGVLTVHAVNTELKPCRFPSHPLYLSRLPRYSNGFPQQYVMAGVDAVFCHRTLLGMVQAEVSVMFFSPCLNQRSSLPSVYLLTLAQTYVNTCCFQSQMIPYESKKAAELPRRDVMLTRHPADAVESNANKR